MSGDRIREERARLGLSQIEFSGLAGVSRGAQINYEKGDRSPDTEYLAAIAKLGVDILYVVTGVRSQAVPAPYSPITTSSASAKKAAEDTGEYGIIKPKNRKELAFFKLYSSLSEEAKQDILKDIEEAKRVEDMEKKLQDMSVELARVKKGA